MPDYIEIDSDLLILTAEGGDYNRREIAARIENMSPAEKRILREALETLDELLDAEALDRHLNRE